MDDRRKYQRFKLDDACIIKHDVTVVGTIVDISPGGLCCMCLDQNDCSQGRATQVDIYCKKYDLCAEDINIRVLDTGMVQGEFMKDLGLRKCRAEFRQLDDSQQAQLANILVRSSVP